MNAFWRRLRARLRYRRFDAELDEELAFHHAMKSDALARDGVSADDLASRTTREMGNETRAREDARAVWIAPWIDSVRQDLSYAVRSLRRQPGFTIAALAALVLALGLNTSLFSVFSALALRPWPVADAGRVVTIFDMRASGRKSSGFSFPEYLHFRDHTRTLTGLAAWRENFVAQIGDDDDAAAKRFNIAIVSANYFDVLRVPTSIGRAFRADEDRPAAPQAVAMISDSFWRNHFASESAIIGRTVRVNGVTFTIVGVVARGFNGTQLQPSPIALWIPMAAMPLISDDPAGARAQLESPANCCTPTVGRLAPGATREQARLELDLLSRDFRTSLKQEISHPVVMGTTLLSTNKDNQPLVIFALMFLATTLVLLLACANVGNLLLARAMARQREIAIRLSLGASRGRVVRQLLTESLLLALVAGAIGIAAAYVVPGAIMRAAFVRGGGALPDVSPDWRLLLFTSGLCALACLLFGLVPAIRSTRIDVASLTGTRSTSSGFRLRGSLLAVQLTISLILLVSAALLTRGIGRLNAQDPGYTIDGVMIATVQLPAHGYTKPRIAAFARDLASALHERADLQPSAMASTAPLSMGRRLAGVTLPGEGENKMRGIQQIRVSPEYFDLLGIPLVAGRAFTAQDDTRDVAIVNETMARELWPNENPIGRTIIMRVPTEIIGVARDARTAGLDRMEAMFYSPLAADFPPNVLIKPRTTIDGAARTITSEDVANAMRTVVQRLDLRVEVTVEPLRVTYDLWMAQSRVGVNLATGVALLALVLAAIGVFGVFAYLVQERTQEIGLRMAIGAQPHQVVLFVFRSTAWATLSGLGIGLIGSFAGSRLLAGQLYGVSPFDPLSYAIASAILAAAAAIATCVPARRATRIDPIAALRCD